MAIREIVKGKKYQIIVSYYDHFGKRRQKTKVVECGIREARKLDDKLRAEVIDKPIEDTCTVRALLESYIKHARVTGAKETTLYGYEFDAKRLYGDLGNVLAKDLASFQVDLKVTNMVELDDYATKTIHNSINLLSAAYNYAISSKLLHYNPCDDVTLPELSESEKVIIQKDQMQTFIDKLQEMPRDFRVACYLGVFLGMRRSEILGLTKNDISEFGTLSIRKVRVEVRNKSIVQTPKTKKSRRTMAVPDFVMDEIKALIEEHKDFDCDYLIQFAGKPIKHTLIESRMRAFAKKNGFEGVTLHGLRHTYASLLHESGEFDLASISTALGHSNLTTTLNIYTHVFEGASNSSKRMAQSIQSTYGKKEETEETDENCCISVAN